MKTKINFLDWIKAIQDDNVRKYDRSLFYLNQAKNKLSNKDRKLIKEIDDFIESNYQLEKLEIEVKE